MPPALTLPLTCNAASRKPRGDTAAPELAGDMNIDMDIVWCMAKRALLIVLL